LVTTDVGVTFLSFAWDAVPAATGYDVVLTKVSTNTIVYSSNNTPATTVTIPSLEAGTLYRIDVLGVCANGQKGNVSSLVEETNDFVIDELVCQYNGSSSSQVNHFALFPASTNEEISTYYKVIGPKSLTTKFEMISLSGSPLGLVHMRHGNAENKLQILSNSFENALNQNQAGWVTSNQFAYVVSSEGQPSESAVLQLNITLASNNWYYLDWVVQNNSGYKVVQLNPSGMGVINNPKNELQSQDEINGIEERDESISESTPFAIWPNPFNDLLYIQGATPANVQLFDINGKLMYQYNMDTTETNTTIPTADLAKGVYLVRYETADSVKTIKVVKTN
jgi:hypothetical protein